MPKLFPGVHEMNLSLCLPTSQYTLRPYQQDAVDAGLRYFRGDSRGGAMMMLPTGSGKSLIIAGIARGLDEPTLVFQPRKEILEQNLEKLRAYGEEPTIYSASMNRKQISNLTLATIGSVVRKLEPFQRFKNIIIDECHFVNPKQGMYRDFLEIVGGRVLGLTATPYRLVTDGYYGGSILKFLTRTRPKVFDKLIYHVQNRTLFDGGYLSRLVYKQIGGFDSGELELNTTGADYTDTSVRSYYQHVGFAGTLQKVVRECLASGRRNILVFTRFVEESQALVEKIDGAEMVTAETKKRDREAIIERFRSGETRVVSNVGVLTTGFDYPELETIIIARPTMSLALYYQMIGRGVRVHPGKSSSLVIDMCDNYARFGKIEDLRLTASRPGLWYIESKGKQLTNKYFGDPPNHHHTKRRTKC